MPVAASRAAVRKEPLLAVSRKRSQRGNVQPPAVNMQGISIASGMAVAGDSQPQPQHEPVKASYIVLAVGVILQKS